MSGTCSLFPPFGDPLAFLPVILSVLMNLFAGKKWRHRHREQIYGHGAEVMETVGCVDRLTRKHTLAYVK